MNMLTIKVPNSASAMSFSKLLFDARALPKRSEVCFQLECLCSINLEIMS